MSLSSGTGTVTAATATQLIVTLETAPVLGYLTVVVTSNGGSSGAAVQVATVIPAVVPKPITPTPILAIGSGIGVVAQVQVMDTATHNLLFQLTPFGNFTGGARVAVGDVNGDGALDVIVGAGPGGGPQVRVYDGKTGQPLSGFLGSFYGIQPSSFTGGVFVAVGDVNGDGFADVIVGADAGGGPQVDVFSGKDGSRLASFNALSASFTGGVRVAAGDVNGDGRADIIAAAGPGGGPQVTIYDGFNGIILNSFYAFQTNFHGGVNVAASDINGDGKADIIAAAGPGGGPQVTIYDGTSDAILDSFYAFQSNFHGGVNLAASDIDGDGRADIIAAAGAGGRPQVTIYDGTSGTILDSFYADPSNYGGDNATVSDTGPGRERQVDAFSLPSLALFDAFFAGAPHSRGGVFVGSQGGPVR